MPSPVVMAAALARRTKNAKIAILGSAFCLREHPLTLAEEHAMIDVITGGRLITGMVRGIGAEYYSMGVNPAFSHARFQEAHDLVVQAWTKPGPFAFEGKHYHFEYVNVWPRPISSRIRRSGRPRPAKHGDDRMGGASVAQIRLPAGLQPDPVGRALSQLLSRGPQKIRLCRELRPDRLVDAGLRRRHRPEGARRGQAAYREPVQRLLRLPFEMLFPPGYLSPSR